MAIATATVATLTAEVRVLMVGSRQITRSVFRQLDEVPDGQCEVMGRVNEDGSNTWVVGRDRRFGNLVRAKAKLPYPPSVEPMSLAEKDRLRRWRDMAARHIPISLSDLDRWKLLEVKYSREREWTAQAREIFSAWAEKTPLIVLAGLK
jgi:hypothetical protein